MDLIDDDPSAQPLQRELRLGQRGEIGRVLEIESGHWPVRHRQAARVHARQRGLAGLTGPEQRDHGVHPKAVGKLGQVAIPLHACLLFCGDRDFK